MATNIPKQLYVTVQYRKDASTESGLLGFASPYTKDSAFFKRKKTQETWAYGYGASFKILEDDSIVAEDDARCKPTIAELFITNSYPRILNNEPVAGFEIAKSVRRSGWGGGGNVVWRLADPRGFELEISSENFAAMLDCCTMINGVIQEQCVWGREGAKNILLPVTSEPYKEAFKQTARENSKVSLKDLQIGDTVDIVFKTMPVEEQDGCEFLGKQFVIVAYGEGQDSYDHSAHTYHYGEKFQERYIFRSKTNVYYSVSSPKVSSIVNKTDKPRTSESVSKELNKLIQSMSHGVVGISYPIMFLPEKLNKSKLVAELVDAGFDAPTTAVPSDQEVWKTEGGRYNIPLYIVEIDGQYYAGGKETKYTTGNHHNIPKLKVLENFDLSKHRFGIRRIATNSYYNRNTYSSVTINVPVDRPIKVQRIKLTYGNDSVIVKHTGYAI